MRTESTLADVLHNIHYTACKITYAAQYVAEQRVY